MTHAGGNAPACGAHVVAVDPATLRSYYPIPADVHGRRVLIVVRPIG